MGADHPHRHDHTPADFGRAFAIGIVLNTCFVVVEAVCGIISGSMALIADAGHNLSDVGALVFAWAASIAAKRPASPRFTWGYKNATILAALANAVLLLIAVALILVETLERLGAPRPVDAGTVVVVAAAGIAINSATALLFLSGWRRDLNIRGAFLHMAADALVSLGVVVAGVAILVTGAWWIDPLTSLAILAVIAWSSWALLRDSTAMGMLGVPPGVDERAVRAYLAGLPGVVSVQDLHIWPLSTTETALTAHLHMPDGHPGDAFLHRIAEELARAHAIGHVTIQVEREPICAGGC